MSELESVAAEVWLPLPAREELRRARSMSSDAAWLLSSGSHGAARVRAAEARLLAEMVAGSVLELTTRYIDESELRTWRR